MKLFLEKGFRFRKGHLYLTKGHLDRPKGRIPPNQKLFLTLLIQIKKKEFFLKRALFNKASDSRTLFLPEIGPDDSNLGIAAKMFFQYQVNLSELSWLTSIPSESIRSQLHDHNIHCLIMKFDYLINHKGGVNIIYFVFLMSLLL